MIKRVIAFLQREGWQGIRHRIRQHIAGRTYLQLRDGSWVRRNDYSQWLRRYDEPTDEMSERIGYWCAALEHAPLISIIMPVYRPDHQWLIAAIDSVRHQLYPHWELCIADDASGDAELRQLLMRYSREDRRIRVCFREQNGHISAASNTALGMASGSWVAFLDQDDLLSEHALYCVARTALAAADPKIIYSDEDIIATDGARKYPYFKSDWNPELFSTHNMFCHLTAFRRSLVEGLGGMRTGFEGAQDYDLALRCIEKVSPAEIQHIPRILYHWRAHPMSTASGAHVKSYALRAGEKALSEHLSRIGVPGKVEIEAGGYRIHYELPKELPMVSIILTACGGTENLMAVVRRILEKTSYRNYEVLITGEKSAAHLFCEFANALPLPQRLRVKISEQGGSQTCIVNSAAATASGEYLALLHDIDDVLSPNWLEEMVALAGRPGVGAVGACLRAPNGTMVHGAGVVGVGGTVGFAHRGLPRGNPGYYSRAQRVQAATFVSAACMVVQKQAYLEVGGLDESFRNERCRDADFCLRLGQKGYRSIWTPYAELRRINSRLVDVTCEVRRGNQECQESALLKTRWADALEGDRAYNFNLALDSESLLFTLAWPSRTSWIDEG